MCSVYISLVIVCILGSQTVSRVTACLAVVQVLHTLVLLLFPLLCPSLSVSPEWKNGWELKGRRGHRNFDRRTQRELCGWVGWGVLQTDALLYQCPAPNEPWSPSSEHMSIQSSYDLCFLTLGSVRVRAHFCWPPSLISNGDVTT